MRGMWENQSQRDGYVTTEAEIGEGERATSQHKWPLEAEKGQITNSPLEPLEETLPTDTLTLFYFFNFLKFF